MSRVATTPLRWRRASPGSRSLEKRSDAEFPPAVAARGGPVSTRFQGAVTLRAFDLSNGYRISGKGRRRRGCRQGADRRRGGRSDGIKNFCGPC